MKKIKKIAAVIVVTTTMLMSSLVASAASVHTHSYPLFSRTWMHTEYIDCVIEGCTVRREHFRAVYQCTCGDGFWRDEADDYHSMDHSKG